jgi:hypothetical protein
VFFTVAAETLEAIGEALGFIKLYTLTVPLLACLKAPVARVVPSDDKETEAP